VTLFPQTKVLKYFGKNTHGELLSYLEKQDLRTSIWTIDLAYMLNYFDIENHMSTITLGVDENYENVDFYSANLTDDNARVSRLFRESKTHNVNVTKESINMERIVTHLESQQPIIILVDWRKLFCLYCDNIIQEESDSVLSDNGLSSNKRYQGHFICLTGVDRVNNRIFFANPSAKTPICACHLSDLEVARKSYGTDEDIIFITQPVL